MAIKLSPRLARLAAWVEPGRRVADVGTDHAYIPIYLLQRGLCPEVWATDNKPGPLGRAEADARAAGVLEGLHLCLCDGLASCPPESVDTVILAGMGGETMEGILNRSPWAYEKRLILQPQTKLSELRRTLADHGVGVADAALVYDTGRIYLAWLALPGAPVRDCVIDPPLMERRDPLLKAWTEERIKGDLKRLRGLRAARERDEGAVTALEEELEALRRAREETLTW